MVLHYMLGNKEARVFFFSEANERVKGYGLFLFPSPLIEKQTVMRHLYLIPVTMTATLLVLYLISVFLSKNLS